MTSSPGLTPVLIVGGGRNGTTLLMQMLGSSPRVAFDRSYPFEHRYLTYLIRLAEVVHPAEPTQEWTSRAMIQDRDGAVGPIPWADAELLDVEAGAEPLTVRLFRSAWATFSDTAAAAMRFNHGATEVTHYAEKAPNWVVDRASELLASKRLYPYRDPRDQYLSILAFNAKRKTFHFGARRDDTPESFAERFSANQQKRFRRLASIDTGPDDLLVRYEEMVVDPHVAAAKIGAAIGVELDAAAVTADRDKYERHMTSGSPMESVARWRREMPAAICEIFASTMGTELERFGYEA